MIPAFSHSGVLPPFDAALGPIVAKGMSPYVTTMSDLAARFATSPERVTIIKGLLAHRAELRRLGFDRGFQWIDGSFVEDVESTRGTPPQDIDVITYFYLPPGITTGQELNQIAAQNPEVFSKAAAKHKYRCDPFFECLAAHPELLVKRTRYWFGLFSHTRSGVWKGILEIPLASDDAMVTARL